jgi:hypothetical protein
MQATQVKFGPVDGEKETLFKCFKDDMVNGGYSNTLAVIEKNLGKKNGIVVKFYSSTTPGVPRHYIVTVQGMNDQLMVRLGRMPMAFPRGFHIVWFPEYPVKDIAGFLPKFDNDDEIQKQNQHAGHKMQEMMTQKKKTVGNTGACSHLKISLKYSGSLGLVIVYEHQGQFYYTAMSKNSADHEGDTAYARDNLAIFQDFLDKHPDLIRQMVDSEMTVLSFEVMYKTDQTHGAEVRDTSFVLTSGFWRCETARNNGMAQLCPQHPRWQQLGLSFGLPVDGGYKIPVEDETRVLEALMENRDNMTFELLEHILQGSELPGNIRHDDIYVSKDVVEGLVISKIGIDGNLIDVVKFKFPVYVSRTMCLRPYFALKPESWTNEAARKAVTRFCQRWCASEEGSAMWYKRLMAILLMWNSGQLMELLGEEHRVTGIGMHILAMDRIQLSTEQLDAIPCPISQRIPAHVVVVVGPVGAGKSTLGEALASNMNGNGIHIDGDFLGLSENDVKSLKAQRQVFTVWKVLEALMQRKTPILSCGGGVLFSGGDRLVLLDVADRIGLELRITLILAAYDDGDIDPSDLDAVKTHYSDSSRVAACVEHRIRTKKWSPVPVVDICKRSEQNFRFFELLRNHASRVMTCGAKSNTVCLEKLADICPSAWQEPSIMCTQSRYLCRVNDMPICSHITVEFDKNGLIPVSCPSENHRHGAREVTGVKLKLELEPTGVLEEDKSSKKNDSVRGGGNKNGGRKFVELVWIPDLFPSGEAHVTINPGPVEVRYMRDISRALREKRSGKMPLDSRYRVMLPEQEFVLHQLAEKPAKVEILYGPFGIM